MSDRKARRCRFNGRSIRVKRLDQFDFAGVDIGLFSAGASISAKFAPLAAAAGCVVIDNTSQFRYDDDIPLVVPEVNPGAIAEHRARGIIANPNCSTIQMVVALKPILDAVGIERINVATYQSVSGAGAKGIRELAAQTADLLNAKPIEPKAFTRQIAFNVIPHIDVFLENGYTKEEMKMVWETRKILEAPDILVNPTCVRVPVFYGHSEAVHIETRDQAITAEARANCCEGAGRSRARRTQERWLSNRGGRRRRQGCGVRRSDPRRYLASPRARSLDRFRQCPERCRVEQCTNCGAFARRTTISVTCCTLSIPLLSYLFVGHDDGASRSAASLLMGCHRCRGGRRCTSAFAI